MKALFNTYKEHKGPDNPNETKLFISQNEYINIFQTANCLDQGFIMKDLYACYSNSIRQKGRNVNTDYGPKMNYNEFLEGMLRAVEYIKIDKLKCVLFTLKQYQKLHQIGLHVRFESLMNTLIDKIFKEGQIPGIAVIDKSAFDL